LIYNFNALIIYIKILIKAIGILFFYKEINKKMMEKTMEKMMEKKKLTRSTID
jgi:hypothetical protein